MPHATKSRKNTEENPWWSGREDTLAYRTRHARHALGALLLAGVAATAIYEANTGNESASSEAATAFAAQQPLHVLKRGIAVAHFDNGASIKITRPVLINQSGAISALEVTPDLERSFTAYNTYDGPATSIQYEIDGKPVKASDAYKQSEEVVLRAPGTSTGHTAHYLVPADGGSMHVAQGETLNSSTH